MQNNRNTPEHRQWRREVLRRDGEACRVCEYQGYSHVHHIKPLEKYPDLATDIDNGITLCGNCHTRLKGKEESTNLQTIIEMVKRKPDMQTADQLERLNVKFCDYLEPLLKSDDIEKRNNAVLQLLRHLYVYPNSLNQFLPLIQRFLNKESRLDEGLAEQIIVEFLKDCSSGAALQLLEECETRIEAETQWNSLVSSGEDCLKKEDYDCAIIYLTKAIERDPTAAYAYRKRGEAHGKKGNDNSSIIDYTQAILLSNDAEIQNLWFNYIDRGMAYFAKAAISTSNRGLKTSYFLSAKADFDEAIRLNPSSHVGYLVRGTMFKTVGVSDLARKDLEKADQLRENESEDV